MVPAFLIMTIIIVALFNSVKPSLVIACTVPFAFIGITAILLPTQTPFGFMSLLGILALVGVVVNNAIVLLEVIESRRKAGVGVTDAVQEAVQRRFRPILLTTATTVAGLLPLALSPSTLWPPMAWAMISGLTASTLLTLVVVPALYVVLFSIPVSWPHAWRSFARRCAQAALVVLVFLFTNLVIDLAYGYLDPRVRLERAS